MITRIQIYLSPFNIFSLIMQRYDIFIFKTIDYTCFQLSILKYGLQVQFYISRNQRYTVYDYVKFLRFLIYNSIKMLNNRLLTDCDWYKSLKNLNLARAKQAARQERIRKKRRTSIIKSRQMLSGF